MEVDPSLSQFKHPTNYSGHDHNEKQQGIRPKRTTNSGRFTGPKIQRVNHLNDEDDPTAEASYEEEAEQAVDDIEGDELNFLEPGPSCLGFRSQ